MPKIVINGRQIEVKAGLTVLEVARKHGIEIPTLCFAEHLPLSGTCRMCLVDIKGVKNMRPACITPIRDGMIIDTESLRVRELRRANIEFIMAHHPVDCEVCDSCAACELQSMLFKYGDIKRRFAEKKRSLPKQSISSKLSLDMNRCIHCRRCARYARDVVGSKYWATLDRGWHTYFGVYGSSVEFDNESDGWGNLIDLCPTGAITAKEGIKGERCWNLVEVYARSNKCQHHCRASLWISKNDDQIKQVTVRRKDGEIKSFICDKCRFESFDIEEWNIEKESLWRKELVQ